MITQPSEFGLWFPGEEDRIWHGGSCCDGYASPVFVDDVLAKLEDTSFRLLIIACVLHFFNEIVRIGIDDGLFINLSEKEFGLLTEYVVDIDTYQYLYLLTCSNSSRSLK